MNIRKQKFFILTGIVLLVGICLVFAFGNRGADATLQTNVQDQELGQHAASNSEPGQNGVHANIAKVSSLCSFWIVLHSSLSSAPLGFNAPSSPQNTPKINESVFPLIAACMAVICVVSALNYLELFQRCPAKVQSFVRNGITLLACATVVASVCLNLHVFLRPFALFLMVYMVAASVVGILNYLGLFQRCPAKIQSFAYQSITFFVFVITYSLFQRYLCRQLLQNLCRKVLPV